MYLKEIRIVWRYKVISHLDYLLKKRVKHYNYTANKQSKMGVGQGMSPATSLSINGAEVSIIAQYFKANHDASKVPLGLNNVGTACTVAKHR